MRTSNLAIILLVAILMFSIFVANLANLINVDINYTSDKNSKKQYESKPVLKMTDTDQHLLYFLQISDMHISIFHDLSRISDLKDFCENTVPVFKPPLVIASGDLTDGKEPNDIGSRQYEQEWIAYREALKNCIENKTAPLWLDIRGNHDNFNIPDMNYGTNYYKNYSVQGKNHARSYKYNLDHGGEKYAFIGVDACTNPGPRRPFNFVGMLKGEELEKVISLANTAENDNTNYTIWFGHYPTSCIMSRNGAIRSILGSYSKSYVYLCGHYHQLGGVVPNMYSLQKDGFLELELGDWKENRVYRLLAMDHGMLSFIDQKHNDWPVVLITNPKHALYAIPQHENPQVILESTHIRILAFSTAPITQVQVRINQGEWSDCRNVKGPLYVLEWTPSKYSEGLNEIIVKVKDEFGREKIISQPFSLDGTRLQFGILARFALMGDISAVFQCMFGFSLVICTFPLCLLRYLDYQLYAGKIKIPRRSKFGYTLIRKLWILSSIDRIFYPLMLYTLYICIGPWSIGYIIEDNLGVIFAWGIITNGAFLPGSFTYAYGSLQLIAFHLPMIFLLANVCDIRVRSHANKMTQCSKCQYITQYLVFATVLCIQILCAYFFFLAYGTMAFLIGPLRTWGIGIALWLWYRAETLPEKCTKWSVKVWFASDKVRSPREIN